MECFYAAGSLEPVLETALESIEQFDMMADGASGAMEKSKIDLSDFTLVQPQQPLQFCAATIPASICKIFKKER